MSKTLDPVLKWAGGKRWLVHAHADLFPTEFGTYLEPFLGSAAVFFRLRPKRSVLSDRNCALIDTYRALRNDPQGVRQALQQLHEQHCKEFYYSVRKEVPDSEIQKAARFIYLNRTCWNGLYRVNRKGEFNVPIGTKNTVVLPTDDFDQVSKLLKRAKLLAGDFSSVIDLATENDFLFVDPPYTTKHNLNGFLKYNEILFSWADQERLHNAVIQAANRGVKILVLNANHESVCSLYKRSGRQVVLRRQSVLAGRSKNRCAVEELAILYNI